MAPHSLGLDGTASHLHPTWEVVVELTNRAAFDEAVEAMATGPEHRALVTACRYLADWVDEQPFLDVAWREYRLALKVLQEAVSDGGSDSFDDLTKKLRGAEVSDAEDS